MTSHALQHRIRPAGPWQRLLPGVYLTNTGIPTVAQRRPAPSVLRAGARNHDASGGL